MSRASIDEVTDELRARLHARFPKAVRWAPPPPPPWELIRAVLAKGRADGLDDLQLAGGVYAVLVAEGLLSEGRA